MVKNNKKTKIIPEHKVEIKIVNQKKKEGEMKDE